MRALGWGLPLSLLLGAGCEGRSHFGGSSEGPRSGPFIHEIDLSRGVTESGSASFFGAEPHTSYAHLIVDLTDAAEDEDGKGYFVSLGGAHLNFAMASELGRTLGARRSKGAPVVCHADGLDNATWYFAALACSEIWVSPAGGVDAVGIAFQLIFGKSLFDKLGIGVDFLQIGKYKGAEEPYTRDEPSPEARETIEGTLRDLRAAWISGLSEGRGADMSGFAEDGPYSAVRARDLGLIDRVGYVDEARTRAREAASVERSVALFGGPPKQPGGLDEALFALGGGDPTRIPHVTVVHANGAITMESGGGLMGGSSGISERALGKIITRLTKDDAVKAVVLRIDSPGGSALASDLLWHKLMLLREKKPLYISVGAMAASGGYYLASAGEKVFAEPTSIVGSIGVVGGKFSLRKPLESVGIHGVTIAAAPAGAKANRATYLSALDGWDDGTRERVRDGMQTRYDTFLDRITTGRGLTREELDRAAQGRIFGGATAKEMKLVDELGGLSECLTALQEHAGLEADTPVVVYEEVGSLVDLLGGDPGAEESLRAEVRRQAEPTSLMLAELPEEAQIWLTPTLRFEPRESAYVLTPYIVMVR